MLRRHVRVVRIADVRDEKDLLAVAGDRFLAAIGLKGGLLLGVGLRLGAISLEDVVLRVVDDLAEGAVDDDHLARLDVLRGVRDGKDCGDLERTGDNGGVGGAATGLGDDAGNVLLVDVGGHRGRELLDDDDGVLREGRKVDDLLAKEVGQKAGLDVGHVGRALAEELVVHVGEHVEVHVVGLAHGLLGAHAGIDGPVHHVLDSLVLGELDVRAHDGGSLLAHRLLHALDLHVRLLDELRESLVVAGLLGLRILGLRRGEGQVGCDRNLRDTNAVAVRSIYAFEHLNLPFALPGIPCTYTSGGSSPFAPAR